MEGGWAGGVSVLPAVRMALADINAYLVECNTVCRVGVRFRL